MRPEAGPGMEIKKTKLTAAEIQANKDRNETIQLMKDYLDTHEMSEKEKEFINRLHERQPQQIEQQDSEFSEFTDESFSSMSSSDRGTSWKYDGEVRTSRFYKTSHNNSAKPNTEETFLMNF